MNISSEKKIMDLEKKLVVACVRVRVWEGSELGLIRHNLEYIYKEILLNSIENYV